MAWFSVSSERMLDDVFKGREPLNDSQLRESYLKKFGVTIDTVAKVRRILSEILHVDLRRIRDTDDFSKELAFFWDLDSLADVEIVEALEEEFQIVISDAEAEAMKTFET